MSPLEMQQQTPASSTNGSISPETLSNPAVTTAPVSKLTMDEGTPDGGQVYPIEPKLILITLSLMLAVFCVALDNTVSSSVLVDAGSVRD